MQHKISSPADIYDCFVPATRVYHTTSCFLSGGEQLSLFVCGEAQTLDWSVLLLLLLLLLLLFLLALLSYYRIYAQYRKTYKNKSVDTKDLRYCAKFQPFVSCIFAENCQKRFCNFSRFHVFCLFDLQNDLKIQIWPDPPIIIWECPIFSIL